MSREPEVRPFPFTGGDWRRRSRSEKKVPVGPDRSQHSLEDSTASVQSVQPIALKHAVVVWLSKYCVVLIYFSVSLALLVLLVYLSFFAASMDDGSKPDFLSCRSWGFGTSCGLWGVDCRPFESEWTAFRCPTRCTLDQSSSLAVFGSSPYRADSRICRAATHAGVVGPNGGCAFYRFSGAADAFYPSTANGVTTKGFLSWFPKTIEFEEASSTYCSDLSWWILSVGFIATAVVASVLLSWALFPSTSFHLHHTMLGALIIPVTSFPTPAAAFSQAAALGLFIQGYARWGWHSYLDTIPTYLTIAVPENAPNTTNVTSSRARVVWEPLESVQAYSLRLNRVEVYRGVDTSAVISNLKPNITYFVGVAGVASWGIDGRVGPLSNFTTLEE
ncbi:hypothetical protein PC113_g8118 [Phytophthora cactorum]|uniref:Fibronectin type-III domain-containing protein n=1 Tax=Phytophthora cactorum TaxID=29920 RepID=A0A8T1CPP9_9STRA|nr:hypothetical protein PC113_g8118 [Phytophthora cactorum]KAG2926978.1 hypothetical protein PC115_g7727 [Phytophthora cactorum]